MNKFYLSLLFLTFACFINADDQQDSVPTESILTSEGQILVIEEQNFTAEEQTPRLEKPIHLFKDRDLFEQLKVQEKLEKVGSKLSAEQINLLKSIITAKNIKEATGRQVPDIGHDNKRIRTYTGTPAEIIYIVLTFSGQETLENSVASLEKNRLAHNFIIDTNGKIYPVTKEGESLEDALLHRPFAVGVSGKVIDGKCEERDMNAVSITISVVGKDNKPTTQEQEETLVKIVSWLSKKFEIKPYNVVDYGTVALPYGRRNTQENLPWEKLAETGLVVWPKVPALDPEEVDPIITLYPSEIAKISCALRKTGLLCPIVTTQDHEDFKQTLKTFQKHYKCREQSGLVTLETYQKLTDIIHQMEKINPELRNIHPTTEEMYSKEFRTKFSK